MNWSKPDFWDFNPFCHGALVPKGSFEETRVALKLGNQVAWNGNDFMMFSVWLCRTRHSKKTS